MSESRMRQIGIPLGERKKGGGGGKKIRYRANLESGGTGEDIMD